MMVEIRQVKWLASFAIQTLSFNSFQPVIICSWNFGVDLTSQDRLVMNIQGTSLITLLSFHLLLTRRFLLVLPNMSFNLTSHFLLPSFLILCPKRDLRPVSRLNQSILQSAKRFQVVSIILCVLPCFFHSFFPFTLKEVTYSLLPCTSGLSRSSFRSSSFPSS